MDESSSQSCDQFSQSLPTVEALYLNNNNNGNYSDVVSDKQPPIDNKVVSNKLTVHASDDQSRISAVGKFIAVSSRHCNVANDKLVKVDRNGKDVTLPGNQETPGAVDEAQKLPHKVSLPYVDDGVDSSRSHHQNGGKHCAPSKRPSRKMSQQQQDKNANNLIRVTRSTSKMMAAQVTAGNSKAPAKQLDDSRQCVDSLSADDSTNTNHGQIKYNKSRGFPSTAKATNWTRSEMNSIFTNNGIKCDGHHCRTVNSEVNKGSHVVDHILNDSLLPLQDVTNSSSNGDTTGTTVAKPHAQTRVYDLVAGKKSKKGKRQQLRKAAQVPHKKKTTEANKTSTSTSEEEHLVFTNDDKSVAHVKDTITLPHSQDSEHSRNSRELVSEYKRYLYKA